MEQRIVCFFPVKCFSWRFAWPDIKCFGDWSKTTCIFDDLGVKETHLKCIRWGKTAYGIVQLGCGTASPAWHHSVRWKLVTQPTDLVTADLAPMLSCSQSCCLWIPNGKMLLPTTWNQILRCLKSVILLLNPFLQSSWGGISFDSREGEGLLLPCLCLRRCKESQRHVLKPQTRDLCVI